MDENIDYSKGSVLQCLRDPEKFHLVKDFIIDSGVTTYSFNDDNRIELHAIDTPEEFGLKYMEIALSKWFLMTRGE